MKFLVDLIVRKFLRKIIPNGWGIFLFAGLSILMKFIAFVMGLIPELCSSHGWFCNPEIVLGLSAVNDFLIFLLRHDTETKPFESKLEAKKRIEKELKLAA